MGKTTKAQQRAAALTWLKGDATDRAKEHIRKALVQFLYDE